MNKVYVEMICDEDVAEELKYYSPERVDIITCNDNLDTIIEMGGEKYRGEEK